MSNFAHGAASKINVVQQWKDERNVVVVVGDCMCVYENVELIIMQGCARGATKAPPCRRHVTPMLVEGMEKEEERRMEEKRHFIASSNLILKGGKKEGSP